MTTTTEEDFPLPFGMMSTTTTTYSAPIPDVVSLIFISSWPLVACDVCCWSKASALMDAFRSGIHLSRLHSITASASGIGMLLRGRPRLLISSSSHQTMIQTNLMDLMGKFVLLFFIYWKEAREYNGPPSGSSQRSPKSRTTAAAAIVKRGKVFDTHCVEEEEEKNQFHLIPFNVIVPGRGP